MASGVVYGIDFGTSNSALAIGTAGGVTRYVSDPATGAGGGYQVSTAVCALPNGSLVVGRQAINRKQTVPGSYLDNFKLLVGQTSPVILGGQRRDIPELVSAVLTFMYERALTIVPQEPDVVVITVPASWTSAKKEIIRKAAIGSGLGSATIELMAEPAAAAAYALSQGLSQPRNGRLLVYDLGGGTFDCAVAEARESAELHVLDYAGCDVGGSLFDEAVQYEVQRKFPTQTALLFSDAVKSSAELLRLLQLRTACERLKCELSSSPSAVELLAELDPPVEFELTRNRFESLIEAPVDETLHTCNNLLKRLKMSWADIGAVFPVGGSSVIPLVRQRLHEVSGKTPVQVYDSHLATVNGALLRARAIAGVAGKATAPTIVDFARTQNTTANSVAPAQWEPTNVDNRKPPSFDGLEVPQIQPRWSPARQFFSRVAAGLWAAATGYLAVAYWDRTGVWASIAYGLVLVGLMTHFRATIRTQKSPLGGGVVFFSFVTMLVAVPFGISSMIAHIVRVIGANTQNNVTALTLAAGAAVAGITAFSLAFSLDETRGMIMRYEKAAVKLANAHTQMIATRYVARSNRAMPPVFRVLLDIPSVRIFELGGTALSYAVTAGPRAILIHFTRPGQVLPELDSSLDAWRQSLQASTRGYSGLPPVKVRAVVVIMGRDAGGARSPWSLEAGAAITSEAEFASVVGPFLATEAYRVIVPMVSKFL